MISDIKIEYKRDLTTLFLSKRYVVTWNQDKSGLLDVFAWIMHDVRSSVRKKIFKTEAEAKEFKKLLELTWGINKG